MSYESMSDEDKILQAFDFVARGVPIPNTIAEFLRMEGLYDAIISPVEITDGEDRDPSLGSSAGSIRTVPQEAGSSILRESSHLEAG